MQEWLTVRRVALVTLTIAMTLALLGALRQSSGALTLIGISLLFATAIKSPAQALERFAIPRPLAILMVYLAALGAVALVGLLIVPPLVGEAVSLVQALPNYYRSAVSTLAASENPLLVQVEQQLLSPEVTNWATTNAARLAGELAGRLLNIGAGIAGGFVALVTILAVGFYWINEQGRIERTWFSIMPAHSRPRLLLTWRRIEQRLGAYLRGLILLDLTVGLLCGIGYSVLGIRYALVLGVLAGVLETIPTIGVLITAVLVTLVGLTQSPTVAGLALAWTLLVQQVENTFLVPRVMGQAIGVSPLALIAALLIFGSWLGLGGALLAVPLTAIVQIVLEEWVIKDPSVADLAVATHPATIMRLRLRELRAQVRHALRDGDSSLHLDSGPDALLQNVELAIERAMRALPTPRNGETVEAGHYAAWGNVVRELQRMRALLEEQSDETLVDSQLATTLQELDNLIKMTQTQAVPAGAI